MRQVDFPLFRGDPGKHTGAAIQEPSPTATKPATSSMTCVFVGGRLSMESADRQALGLHVRQARDSGQSVEVHVYSGNFYRPPTARRWSGTAWKPLDLPRRFVVRELGAFCPLVVCLDPEAAEQFAIELGMAPDARGRAVGVDEFVGDSVTGGPCPGELVRRWWVSLDGKKVQLAAMTFNR